MAPLIVAYLIILALGLLPFALDLLVRIVLYARAHKKELAKGKQHDNVS